jgi:hypothetical protein
MIRIQFSDGGKYTQVVTFDGEVLELFSANALTRNPRIHISHIETMRVDTDRKGQHKLVTKLAYGFVWPEFSAQENQLEQTKALIAAVEEAKATLQFG